MPELWLNYGTTDIVLDIRVENLLKLENPNFLILEDEIMEQAVSSIVIKEDTSVIPLDCSRTVIDILNRIVECSKKNGRKILIESTPPTNKILSKIFGNSIVQSSGDENYFLKKLNTKNTLFISNVTLDPIFGFAGVPTRIARKLQGTMRTSYDSRDRNTPNSAIKGTPTKIAIESCENSEAMSVEIISNNQGTCHISQGNVNDSYEESCNRFQSLLLPSGDLSVKSMIVTPNGDSAPDLTLSSSLNNLWNSIHVLKAKGKAILVSESKLGLGSQALEEFVKGRLTIDSCYNQHTYIDGMEHILFANELTERYGLGILTTLPRFYLSKLGISAFSKIQEVLERLLEFGGKQNKILIITDPNSSAFENQ